MNSPDSELQKAYQRLYQLARQGNPKAIAIFLNRFNSSEYITTITEDTATIQNNCLNLTVESSQFPLNYSSRKYIYDCLKALKIEYIEYVIIEPTTQKNPKKPCKERIDLTKELEAPQSECSNLNQSKWSVWFPYPSSWLRMLLLILWTVVVVRILGFWGWKIGVILSNISTHPQPLLQALGFAMFGSVLIHSYVYYILVDKGSSPQKKSYPTSRSLWEGTYAMIVLLLSVFITVLIIFPFVPWESCYFSHVYENFTCRYHRRDYVEKLSIVAAFVWLTSGLYLYQIEYVIRNKIPLKRIVRFFSLVILSIVASLLLNTTIKQWDNIYGVFSTFVEPSPAIELSETEYISEDENGGTEEFVDTEQSETEYISEDENGRIEEFVDTEQIEELPHLIEYDTFNDALKTGMEAAKLTQSAKTKQEWDTISQTWEEAIQLLENVPESSPNLETAQNKVVEYQKNLSYSQKIARQLGEYEALIPPDDLNFKKGLEEASNAAFFVQTAKSKPEWEFVATQWQNAIDYMKQVQPDDPNYEAAQERVVQYQKNLEYARLAGNQAKE